MTITGQACTRVLVSWDGNGLFTGPHDDVTADVGGTPGVSIDLGRDGARQLSPPKVSAADFALRNDTGRYSQERADSPVYQRVLPGRPVRVETEHGTTDEYDTPTRYDETDYYDGAATFTLARTVVDDIAQETALGDQMVTLRTLGLETLLIGTTVTVGLMTAPRVDQCVTAILDAVGWPADRRAVSVSDTTLLYWWCNDRAPWDALLELLASEGPGAIYIANALGEATFHFENRNYRATAARSTTQQQIYFDRRGTGLSEYDEATAYDEEDAYDGEVDTLYFTTLSYDPGFRNIFNEARYPTRRRTVAATPSVIWSYGASLAPSTAGTTLIIHPQDPFIGAVVPVVGTDYTVSGGTVSMSLSAPSGLVAFLTVTATSGVPTVAGPTASPATGLQLRAQPLTIAAETTVTNDVDASESIARFSPIPGQAIPRMLALAGWAEIDPAVARAVCDAWVLRYMVPRPSVTVELRNADGAHVSEILHRRISDRIGLRERNTGLATDVWVNSVALTITGAGGRDIRARFGCEKCDEVAGTLWDFSVWEVTDPTHPDYPVAIWGV